MAKSKARKKKSKKHTCEKCTCNNNNMTLLQAIVDTHNKVVDEFNKKKNKDMCQGVP